MKKAYRWVWVLVAMVLTTTPVLAGGASEAEDDAPMEYTAFHETDIVFDWFDNPDDVVTPWFEEEFGLRLTERYWRQGQDPRQRLNQFLATRDLPDVMVVTRQTLSPLLAADALMDLTELVPEYMPHYWNSLTPEERLVNMDDGRLFFVWKLAPKRNDNVDDIYNTMWAHTPLVREDLLARLGYEFTPVYEVLENCSTENRVPTWDEIMIEPAIETPEDFYNLLREIDELGIVVDGKPLIPWSVRWSIFHFGGMYDLGHWQYNSDDGVAYGYLGSPMAKDYFEFINRCYQEGLLDQEFASQQNPQIMEKVSTGRVGVIMSDTPDLLTAHEALAQIDPSMVYHPIPWPVHDPDWHGYMDVDTPGLYVAAISADTPRETAIRLLEMWDYMYTEEGWDMLVWGPEESGLWEWDGDRRVFTDPAMWDAEVSASETGGPADYGLQSDRVLHKYGDFWSAIANFSAAPERGYPRNISRSYPYEFTFMGIFNHMRLQTGRFHYAVGNRVSYGTGELPGYANTYYWSDFRNRDIVKILTPTTQAEFDAAWAEIMEANEVKGRFTEGQQAMTEWFHSMGVE